MKKNLIRVTSVVVISVMLSGCATSGAGPGGYNAASNSCPSIGPNTGLGALGGAAMGAGIGAASTNNGRGALIGALIGAAVGAIAANVIDSNDCAEAKMAFDKMAQAKVGKTIAWNNPSTGNHGTFTPVTKAKKVDGKICREYKRVVMKSDGTEAANNSGMTCRASNGDWEVVS